jgi:hypothetical protein
MKFDISKLLSNPAAYISDLLADPEISSKIPEILSKLPPEAMESLAAEIAKHMPPQDLPSAAEIAAELAKVMPQSNNPLDVAEIVAQVKGQISVQVVEGYKKLSETQLQMANSLKDLQDRQEQIIQATVEATFKANAQEIIKQVSDQLQTGLTANPNMAAAGMVPQQPKSLTTQIVEILPTLLEAWKTINPPQNNASVIETALRFYVQGLNQGNKLKTGESTTADAAQDLLSLVTPPKK